MRDALEEGVVEEVNAGGRSGRPQHHMQQQAGHPLAVGGMRAGNRLQHEIRQKAAAGNICDQSDETCVCVCVCVCVCA